MREENGNDLYRGDGTSGAHDAVNLSSDFVGGERGGIVGVGSKCSRCSCGQKENGCGTFGGKVERFWWHLMRGVYRCLDVSSQKKMVGSPCRLRSMSVLPQLKQVRQHCQRKLASGLTSTGNLLGGSGSKQTSDPLRCTFVSFIAK